MMKEKITVKDILKDNYDDFKNKYWDKVRNICESILMKQ